MKEIEQCFPVVQFIILHRMVLTFESVDKTIWMKATEWYYYFPVVLVIMLQCLSLQMKSYTMYIQMKDMSSTFPVVLFIMLYKVVLTFET